MADGMAWLAAAPWLISAAIIPLLLLRRSPIRRFVPANGVEPPLVSVIVPARNEAENISACVATLLNLTYPRLEVIVVDDQSTDGTADIVRLIASRSTILTLIEGAPPPSGWLGKPWACWQGYRAARGEILLFTDADTRHDDALLGHAVAGLEQSGAALVSVLPRQRMLSFWERLVLPQIFTTIILRYHDVERVNRATRPRGVIANGQYMLFRRDAYERIGGHEGVASDVVEDLALAQQVVASGERLLLAHADDLMDTRMYRSLGGIVEGWTKNLALGSRRSVPPVLAPLLPWLAGALGLALWVVPPVLLVLCLLTALGGALLTWSLVVTAASVVLWALVHLTMRVPPQHALLYPLGAIVVALLFWRSAWRGRRVRWRGREYAS